MGKCDTLRRILMIGWPIYVFRQNVCVLGLCEPASQHDEVVEPDLPSLLFTVASAMVVAERDLWPRRHPFRPLPQWLIVVMEVLMALLLNNLVLRLVWLPVQHIVMVKVLAALGLVLKRVNEAVGDWGNVCGKLGAWFDSADGIYYCVTFLAGYILVRSFYFLYWDKITQRWGKLRKGSDPSTAPPCCSSLMVPRRLSVGPGRLHQDEAPEGHGLGFGGEPPLCQRPQVPFAELRRSARINNQSFKLAGPYTDHFQY